MVQTMFVGASPRYLKRQSEGRCYTILPEFMESRHYHVLFSVPPLDGEFVGFLPPRAGEGGTSLLVVLTYFLTLRLPPDNVQNLKQNQSVFTRQCATKERNDDLFVVFSRSEERGLFFRSFVVFLYAYVTLFVVRFTCRNLETRRGNVWLFGLLSTNCSGLARTFREFCADLADPDYCFNRARPNAPPEYFPVVVVHSLTEQNA